MTLPISIFQHNLTDLFYRYIRFIICEAMSRISRKFRSYVPKIVGLFLFVVFINNVFFKSSQPSLEEYNKNHDRDPDDKHDDSNILGTAKHIPHIHEKSNRGDDEDPALRRPVKVFNEEPLLKSWSNEFYTEEELEPWLKKPMPKPSDAGAYGKPHKITNPTDTESKLIKQGWDSHSFNQYVCEQISLHRFIGDKRDQECKVRKWRKPLPTTSVIVVFHNEAWCSLLRTVYSVLETSPKLLLKEIILVDDASTFDHLGEKLENYLVDLKIVRLIRNEERIGLIRARLAGAEAATGDVLTFLDAHCECATHWLEPLLERIGEDPTRVICPVIEVIDADTFATGITTARNVQVGILSWSLGFNWSPQKQRSTSVANDKPIESPTMAGGLFSMSRSYFYFLGSYDNQMQVWGGENIEMSLRIWMCGGRLEIHPCSHVGHVFRKKAPYSHPGGGDVITRNNRRVADVWLDDYKEQYYKRVPRAKKINAGDLSERIRLRHDLGCKNFSWYIMNVYPDLYAPPKEDIIKTGDWTSEGRENKYCLDSGNPDGKTGIKTVLYVCHGLGANQEYTLTRQGEIRHNYAKELCLQPDGSSIVTQMCKYPAENVPVEQIWEYTENMQFRHVKSKHCMEAVDAYVLLKPCEIKASQIWHHRDLKDSIS